MSTKKLHRGLSVAVVVLASMASLSAFAGPVTGTAAEVLAIADTQVEALKAGFSSDRRLNTQRDGEKIYQAICQGCHMPQG